MPKYRKKPVIVEAFHMTEARGSDNSEWPDWLNQAWNKDREEIGALVLANINGRKFIIHSLEGAHIVNWGDWIIRGVKGELYACKPEIFALTYEEIKSGCCGFERTVCQDNGCEAAGDDEGPKPTPMTDDLVRRLNKYDDGSYSESMTDYARALERELTRLRSELEDKERRLDGFRELSSRQYDELLALKQQNERLREDAERYRWLRDKADPDDCVPCVMRHDQDSWGNWRWHVVQQDMMDAQIDSARAALAADQSEGKE